MEISKRWLRIFGIYFIIKGFFLMLADFAGINLTGFAIAQNLFAHTLALFGFITIIIGVVLLRGGKEVKDVIKKTGMEKLVR